MNTFAVLGGDQRQVRLTRLLLEDGFDTVSWGLEKGSAPRPVPLDHVFRRDVVILPMPVLRSGRLNLPLTDTVLAPDTLWAGLHPEQVLLGGAVGTLPEELRKDYGLTLADYSRSEDFLIANGVLTAEGTIQRALEETAGSLWQSRCLIIGFGRLGRLLAPRLQALGCRVTVAARRSESRSWAETMGCEALDFSAMDGCLDNFSLMINTVPAVVLDAPQLGRIPSSTLILDLASAPGGVSMEAARAFRCRVLRLPGLPGQTAPDKAAAILKNAVLAALQEREVLS